MTVAMGRSRSSDGGVAGDGGVVRGHGEGVLAPGAAGPWRVVGADTAVSSPAVWNGGFVEGAMAVPGETFGRARLQWVRWGQNGPAVLSESVVPGVVTGAALDLVGVTSGGVAGDGGEVRGGVAGARWVVTWMRPSMATGDTGEWFSVDVSGERVLGSAHAAGDAQREGAGWTRGFLVRRSREGVRIPPLPAVTGAESALGLTVDTARVRSPKVYLRGVLVTEGEDLLTYLPAITAAVGTDGATWVALSRGRCRDSRVELYRVGDGAAVLKASWRVSTEVAFRWMQLRLADGVVVLTWYQELIPIRFDCTRGEGAPGLADHGVRVAIFRAP